MEGFKVSTRSWSPTVADALHSWAQWHRRLPSLQRCTLSWTLLPAAARTLPWMPSHAIALVHMHEGEAAWQCCPRSGELGSAPLLAAARCYTCQACLPPAHPPTASAIAAALQRVLEAAQDQHGLTFQLGFELEFYLLKAPKDGQGDGSGSGGVGGVPLPIDGSNYCHSGAMDAAAPGEASTGAGSGSRVLGLR